MPDLHHRLIVAVNGRHVLLEVDYYGDHGEYTQMVTPWPDESEYAKDRTDVYFVMTSLVIA